MRPVSVPAINEHGFYQPEHTEYEGFAAPNCDEANRHGWKCACEETKLLSCDFLVRHHYNACATGESFHKVRIVEQFPRGTCAESPTIGPKINVEIKGGPETGRYLCVAPEDLTDVSKGH
jgi:hypothetical protein